MWGCVLLCAALAAVAGARWSRQDPLVAMKEAHLRSARLKVELEGDLMLGGLMMVHEREDPCGPIMPQGEFSAACDMGEVGGELSVVTFDVYACIFVLLAMLNV